MLVSLFALITMSGSAIAAEPHPVIDFSPEDLTKAFQQGWDEAPKYKEPDKYFSRARKGIGSIRTAPLASETVSFFWWLHPKLGAYNLGFVARKKYFSDDEYARGKKNYSESPYADKRLIICSGLLSIYPSFGGRYGSIDRYANPNDLKGVRVVMKIGDKVYQPIRQPGDLTPTSGISNNSVFVPQSSTTTVNSSGSATAVGTGGTATVSGSSTATVTNYYTVQSTESYDWYEARFLVAFPAYNEDGSPRLSKNDKEVTFIVLYGANERNAKYNLNEMANLLK